MHCLLTAYSASGLNFELRGYYIVVAGHRSTPGMMTGPMFTLCIIPGHPGFPGMKKLSRERMP